MNGALLRYRLLLWTCAPLITLFNLWQALRAGDSRLFLQRQGLHLPLCHDRPLWLHAASVGEVKAALPLLDALRKDAPQLAMIISTTTATGARLARERLPDSVRHYYLPMDWPGAVRRFIQATRPRAVLVMETELWPNLFIRLAAEDIPLLIVNGRLTSRTMDTGPWVRRLLCTALQGVTGVLARSTQDAENYKALGVADEKVASLGNIKFVTADRKRPVNPVSLGRPYVLAASTREGEEEILASLWQAQKYNQKYARLLVIAPRHPQRREAILRQLRALHADTAIRSRGDTVDEATQIYLADTLGEMEALMAGADIVFMGGSLVDKGGHNILEPAHLGKPILFGPFMGNFSDEAELLVRANAALQVNNPQELGNCLHEWLRHAKIAQDHGRRAARLMEEQAGILPRYVQAISEHCGLQNPPRR